MTKRFSDVRRAARNVLLVGAATVAVAMCGTSTIRGAEALFSSNARIRPTVSAISSGRLPPDCLKTNTKMVKALEEILGRENAENFAKRMERHVESYQKRRAKADSPQEINDAEVFLAGRTHCELITLAGENATSEERFDYLFTMTTMFALADASENGARGAVFGPTAERCASAIIRTCEQR